MAKSQPKNYNTATMQPDELNELKALVQDFMKKINAIDAEIELLKTDRKEVYEEFSEKLDMKTLNAAIKTLKIKSTIEHSDTFELFCEALADPST